MHLRLTIPLVLLTGLLVAQFWGDFVPSGKGTQSNRNTQVKENAFRCLWDNQLWEEDSLTAEVIRYNHLTTIYLRSGSRPDKLAFIFTGGLTNGVHTLDDPAKAYAHITRQDEQCLFTTDEYYQGLLMIDQLDEPASHMTGSFELLAYSDECRKVIRIHNGRFNVKYREREVR